MHLAHWNTPAANPRTQSVATAFLAAMLIAFLAMAVFLLALELVKLIAIENTKTLIMGPIVQR